MRSDTSQGTRPRPEQDAGLASNRVARRFTGLSCVSACSADTEELACASPRSGLVAAALLRTGLAPTTCRRSQRGRAPVWLPAPCSRLGRADILLVHRRQGAHAPVIGRVLRFVSAGHGAPCFSKRRCISGHRPGVFVDCHEPVSATGIALDRGVVPDGHHPLRKARRTTRCSSRPARQCRWILKGSEVRRPLLTAGVGRKVQEEAIDFAVIDLSAP